MEFQVNQPITPVNFSTFFKSIPKKRLSYSFNGVTPPGLTLNPTTGVLTGVPTVAGIFDNIKISVVDSDQKQILSNAFSINIYNTERLPAVISVENDAFQNIQIFYIGNKRYG